MKAKRISSIERVAKALQFQPTDQPPVALSLALQAAHHSNMPLPELLQDAKAFADAQVVMHERWQHDVAVAMRYGAVEAEAFGASIAMFDNGPPNAGAPIVRKLGDIRSLEPPKVMASAPLALSLEVISRMKQALDQQALIAGVAIGPLSGPVMLLGMERWIDVLMGDVDLAAHLVETYCEFALAWSKAQLAAGADALIWFEPMASSDMLPKPLVERLARPALDKVCAMGAPVIFHCASARAAGVADMAIAAGAKALGIGRFDNLETLIRRTKGKIALVGDLDGIDMARWTEEKTHAEVKRVRNAYGREGGLIVCDTHGEIPYQVAPSTLDAVVDALGDRA